MRDANSLGLVRKPIQLKQEDTANSHPLANYEFAEVSVFGYQDTPIGVRRREHGFVRCAGLHFCDGCHFMAIQAQSLNHEAGYVFVRKKTHPSPGYENGLMLHVVRGKSESRPQVILG